MSIRGWIKETTGSPTREEKIIISKRFAIRLINHLNGGIFIGLVYGFIETGWLDYRPLSELKNGVDGGPGSEPTNERTRERPINLINARALITNYFYVFHASL